MPFFDFHVHPALKPQFNKVENRDSPWTVLESHFGAMAIIDSQSSFTQLVEGGFNLIGLALHVPEANMAIGLTGALADIEKFKGVFKCLQPAAYAFIHAKADTAGRLPDLQKTARYFTTFKEELDNINTHLVHENKQVKILTKASDYKEDDANTVHCFLIVEGIHCFYGPAAITTEEGWNSFRENLDSFINNYTLLSINLAHLQFNHAINHCFGVKIFKDKDFYPIGDGIMPQMKDKVFGLIDYLKGRGILIDVKHMSYKARKQYYAYNNHEMPIISTHVGVAGCSAKDSIQYLLRRPRHVEENIWLVERLKKLGHLAETAFNLSSVNLYDEDIRAILQSGGLIGISFDRRIIGYTEYNRDMNPGDPVLDEEYMTGEELAEMFGNHPHYPYSNDDVLDKETISINGLQNTVQLDIRFFFNQIFHILKAGSAIAEKTIVAKSICIGSDFDGLIDSLHCCPSADKIPTFYSMAKQAYEPLAAEAGIDTDGIEDLVDWVFFENGKRFVMGRLG